MKPITILEVVQSGLCNGCGTCAGICPQGALALIVDTSEGIYVPQLGPETCTECGLCYSICPGSHVDLPELSATFLGEEPLDTPLGHYQKCYSGHAVDKKVRSNSTSGGLATALLVFAMESGWIDGALVAGPGEKDPLRPQPCIVRTREEIVGASGSKYCPVPVNEGLAEILRTEGRYAVVGLPCHIHGIRKAEAAIPVLRKRLVLHIGLFCGCMPSFLATEFLLETQDIRAADVARLEYRGGGWPGRMLIETEHGLRKKLPYPAYWSEFAAYFYPFRCLLCTDVVAELADISLGDAWLPQFRQDRYGVSVVVSRNAVGQEAVASSMRAGAIDLAEISPVSVLESQKQAYAFKRETFTARSHIGKILGSKAPAYGRSSPRSSLVDYLYFLLFLSPMNLARRRNLWGLFRAYLWILRQASRLKRLVVFTR